MPVVTIFLDSVVCAACAETDVACGLKKKDGRWFCKRCLADNRPAVVEDRVVISRSTFLRSEFLPKEERDR